SHRGHCYSWQESYGSDKPEVHDEPSWLVRCLGYCPDYGDRVRSISANRSLVGPFFLQRELTDICAESLWGRSICATRGNVDCVGVDGAGDCCAHRETNSTEETSFDFRARRGLSAEHNSDDGDFIAGCCDQTSLGPPPPDRYDPIQWLTSV